VASWAGSISIVIGKGGNKRGEKNQKKVFSLEWVEIVFVLYFELQYQLVSVYETTDM
jgi:hypothetical protein